MSTNEYVIQIKSFFRGWCDVYNLPSFNTLEDAQNALNQDRFKRLRERMRIVTRVKGIEIDPFS